MLSDDRLPLADAPATERIKLRADNRLGAVYSALYSFWSARHAAVTSGQESLGARRDAYSVIMFNHLAKNVVVNDFAGSSDDLLEIVLNEKAKGGTNFAEALHAAQAIMVDNWSTERFATFSFSVFSIDSHAIHRTPIMIFLSDGECSVPGYAIRDLCHSAIRLGWVPLLTDANRRLTGWFRKPLSFHGVSFGNEWDSTIFDSTL